jgi:NNP family nitrate/nitrite transporter-like MFS transporter
VPFVNRWYDKQHQGFALGVYGMGMGGTVIAALTAPKLAKHWSLATPFWVAAALMAAMTVIFWLFARDAPAPPGSSSGPLSFTAPLAVFRHSSRAWALTLFYFLSFGGFVAMFLYLPKLLTGVHHLTKTDAGYRAAGFAFLAVVARPAGAGCLIASAPSASCGSASSPRSCSRRRLQAATGTWCRSRSVA